MWTRGGRGHITQTWRGRHIRWSLSFRVLAEVDADRALDEVVGDLLVGEPLGHRVHQLLAKAAPDVLAHLRKFG